MLKAGWLVGADNAIASRLAGPAQQWVRKRTSNTIQRDNQIILLYIKHSRWRMRSATDIQIMKMRRVSAIPTPAMVKGIMPPRE